MDALLDYLDDIEEVLENSKSVLFSDKVSVEKGKVLDIINEIRLNLPDDIRFAQRILGDHDKIMNDAQNKAKDILEDAEVQAKALTNNHEITRRANEEASDITEEARKDARELRLNAMDYADEILEKAEGKIREYMNNLDHQHKIIMDYFNQMVDVIYDNRQQLRGR